MLSEKEEEVGIGESRGEGGRGSIAFWDIGGVGGWGDKARVGGACCFDAQTCHFLDDDDDDGPSSVRSHVGAHP